MSYKKVGNKRYWYRSYCVRKETDKELEEVKEKINKSWDGLFKDLLKVFKESEVYKMSLHKICIVCKKDKELENFGVRSDNNKLRNTCKSCLNKQAKKRKKLN